MAVVGIDFGNRRVGIAVSESEILATPHSVLHHRGDLEKVFRRIDEIAEEIDATLLILGVPRRTSGTDPKYQRIADQLRRSTNREVVLWDESYSTKEASSLRQTRGSSAKGKAVDHEAAAVILQSWLEERSRRKS